MCNWQNIVQISDSFEIFILNQFILNVYIVWCPGHVSTWSTFCKYILIIIIIIIVIIIIMIFVRQPLTSDVLQLPVIYLWWYYKAGKCYRFLHTGV